MPRNANPPEACTPRQWRKEGLDALPKETTVTDTDPTKPANVTINLDFPFTRGDETIAKVQVRRPRTGELRNLNIADLVQMNVTATSTLLPRITSPRLTAQEVADLDPADFTQFGMEVMDFLLPKATKQAASPEA